MKTQIMIQLVSFSIFSSRVLFGGLFALAAFFLSATSAEAVEMRLSILGGGSSGGPGAVYAVDATTNSRTYEPGETVLVRTATTYFQGQFTYGFTYAAELLGDIIVLHSGRAIDVNNLPNMVFTAPNRPGRYTINLEMAGISGNYYRDEDTAQLHFDVVLPVPDALPEPTCTLTASTPYYRNGNAYTRLTWRTTDASSASITRNGTEIGTGRNNSGREVQLVGQGSNTFRLRAQNLQGTCAATRVVTPARCSDNQDNDGDGFIDEDDQGCWVDPSDPSTYDPEDNGEYNPNYCPDGVEADLRARPLSGGAFRQALTINRGEDIQLRTTSNCARFSNIQGPGVAGSITIGSVSPFATGGITPPGTAGTYTYRYTAEDVLGNRVEDTLDVTVVEPVPTAGIDVDVEIVNPGDTYRVEWSTTNADTVSVARNGSTLWNGLNDVRTVTATMAQLGQTLTYRVRAAMGSGTPAEDTDTVRVLAECADGEDNDNDIKVDALDPGCWNDPQDPTLGYNPNDNDENDPGLPIFPAAPEVTLTVDGQADDARVRPSNDVEVRWNPGSYVSGGTGNSCTLTPARYFTGQNPNVSGVLLVSFSAYTEVRYECTDGGVKDYQDGGDGGASEAEVLVEVLPNVFES